MPSDKPQNYPGKWYKTQKEHWLGWLSGYQGPGAYGRTVGEKRNAEFAYNHIVEFKMLLWIIVAAKVNGDLAKSAQSACNRVSTMQKKSAAIRKQVPWEAVAMALWGSK